MIINRLLVLNAIYTILVFNIYFKKNIHRYVSLAAGTNDMMREREREREREYNSFSSLFSGNRCKKVVIVVVLGLALGVIVRINWTSNGTAPISNLFESVTQHSDPHDKAGTSSCRDCPEGMGGKLDTIHGALLSISELIKDSVSPKEQDDHSFGANDTAFHQTLHQHASDNMIILLSVDYGYIDLALNFYFTSLQKLNLGNYLFVGSDLRACAILKSFNISCFDYIHDRDGGSSSAYNSKAFKRKTHLKTKIVLEALKQGLKVLMVDVDIAFFKNPFQHMECASCDVQIQSDVIEGNSGFYLVQPTQATIRLHREAWEQGLQKPQISNQKALDRKMEQMMRRKEISVKTLSNAQFPNGKVFFEDGKRMFVGDNPCDKCVIVHNNWIVDGEAKVYRFKEYGLWDVDVDRYYSDPTRKYIAYGNPVDFGGKGTVKEEEAALKTALSLGYLLNRTVILPTFHCHGCKYGACKNKRQLCGFNTFFRISTFDKQFRNAYREHVFLQHRKVPDSVKKSRTATLLISTSGSQVKDVSGEIRTLTPLNITQGASVEEVIAWFAMDKEIASRSILNFHSLYGKVLTGFVSERSYKPVVDKLANAFKKTDYRQY